MGTDGCGGWEEPGQKELPPPFFGPRSGGRSVSRDPAENV